MEAKNKRWIQLYAINHGWKKTNKDRMVEEIRELYERNQMMAKVNRDSIGPNELRAIHESYGDQIADLHATIKSLS